MEAQKKKCSKCGVIGPLEELHKDASRKDGRSAYCRECAKDGARKWYAANKGKHLETSRRWRAANPEKVQEGYRRWITTNPERRLEHSRRCRKKMQAENYAQLVTLFGPACLDCEREYPMQIFDYHHLDPATKTRQLSVVGWVWETVRVYVQGCVQLCPTCHRLRHFSERGVC